MALFDLRTPNFIPEPEADDDDEPFKSRYVDSFNAHDDINIIGADEVIIEPFGIKDNTEKFTKATVPATNEVDAAQAQRRVHRGEDKVRKPPDFVQGPR